jgi:hypothetical protein
MHWTLDDLRDLPQPEYDELVSYAVDESQRAARRR